MNESAPVLLPETPSKQQRIVSETTGLYHLNLVDKKRDQEVGEDIDEEINNENPIGDDVVTSKKEMPKTPSVSKIATATTLNSKRSNLNLSPKRSSLNLSPKRSSLNLSPKRSSLNLRITASPQNTGNGNIGNGIDANYEQFIGSTKTERMNSPGTNVNIKDQSETKEEVFDAEKLLMELASKERVVFELGKQLEIAKRDLNDFELKCRKIIAKQQGLDPSSVLDSNNNNNNNNNYYYNSISGSNVTNAGNELFRRLTSKLVETTTNLAASMETPLDIEFPGTMKDNTSINGITTNTDKMTEVPNLKAKSSMFQMGLDRFNSMVNGTGDTTTSTKIISNNELETGRTSISNSQLSLNPEPISNKDPTPADHPISDSKPSLNSNPNSNSKSESISASKTEPQKQQYSFMDRLKSKWNEFLEYDEDEAKYDKKMDEKRGRMAVSHDYNDALYNDDAIEYSENEDSEYEDGTDHVYSSFKRGS
ncbi:Acf4p SCDLUD_000113 [Saccharomycodes ludwigii]|uniref:Acf4p n=1 Tax=Saccharomycodes ludwigii TaxID=36035 RepID=UPI001E8889AA|nr:hypothetical protein SCDLUD_000113 [Saccharomycodes ludwigii]KAH3902534.1 hypothetical protein SCDLUD_000113 [Saccharomycodes ludwigii]